MGNKTSLNTEFKKLLKDFLKIRGGIVAVAFKDLVTGEVFLHNGGRVFPAASLIKIPILMEFFRQVHEESLNPGERVELSPGQKVGGCGVLTLMAPGLRPTLMDIAVLMITVSDNTATNVLIDRLGMKKINRFLKSQGLEKTCLHRRLMIKPNTKIQKNFMTAGEIMTLLSRLYYREILPDGPTEKIIGIMSGQQHIEKLPRRLPRDLKIAHKPGEIGGVCHDAGIVFCPEHPYILCVFTEGLKTAPDGDEIIGGISHALYRHVVEEYTR